MFQGFDLMLKLARSPASAVHQEHTRVGTRTGAPNDAQRLPPDLLDVVSQLVPLHFQWTQHVDPVGVGQAQLSVSHDC